jgi:hypothetical protein
MFADLCIGRASAAPIKISSGRAASIELDRGPVPYVGSLYQGRRDHPITNAAYNMDGRGPCIEAAETARQILTLRERHRTVIALKRFNLR